MRWAIFTARKNLHLTFLKYSILMSDLISLCCISSESKELVVCWIMTNLSTANKVKLMSWNSVWSFITLSSRIIDKKLYSLWQSSIQSHSRINIYSPNLRFCTDKKQMIQNWFYIGSSDLEVKRWDLWDLKRSKTHNHQRKYFFFNSNVVFTIGPDGFKGLFQPKRFFDSIISYIRN